MVDALSRRHPVRMAALELEQLMDSYLLIDQIRLTFEGEASSFPTQLASANEARHESCVLESCYQLTFVITILKIMKNDVCSQIT